MTKKVYNNLENFHDDTINLYSHLDTKLMQQAVELRGELKALEMSSPSTKLSIELVSLTRKLSEFIDVFSMHFALYTNEKNRRHLPSINYSEPTPNTSIVHHMVKLQEELSNCLSRHNDLSLSRSINKLNDAITKMLPDISKSNVDITNSTLELDR